MPERTDNRRILVVDDNAAIHDDFRKVLAPPVRDTNLDALEATLFAEPVKAGSLGFDVNFAFQGRDAVGHIAAANAAGVPYALAFVDMRMPPGWDGLETIERIWEVDREIQIVICSAYSDYPWSELRSRLGDRDSLLIVKKPFDTIEILQCAHALTAKWNLARAVAAQVDDLETAVRARTAELELANRQLAAEVRERDRLTTELRLAQKLETIGQLATGIAHEIATPVQYVGDSLLYLRDSVGHMTALLERVRTIATGLRADASTAPIEALIALLPSADSAAELPDVIATIETGVARITTIVRAMREFAHSGTALAQPIDLNHTVMTALEVSAGRYKSVAAVVTTLGALPPVTCYEGDLGQVLVNLIVNAAHAIEDRGPERGRIGVETRVDGDSVVIAVTDTGCGIPKHVQARIFDPFFTTKDIGRGTGQGLSISRAIVVDRHGGTLTFETRDQIGTTFFIRIPIAGPRSHRESSANIAA